jgi:hypothetical protein
MKAYKYFYLLLFILTSVDSFYSQTDKPAEQEKIYTVLIMPFIENEYYPFSMDQIRESFIYGFRSQGFKVVTNDSVWLKILEEYDNYLVNISTDMAEKIAEDNKVDLIVYGNAVPYSNVRNTGFYLRKIIYKPVLIKVYDANKKSLVLYDRSNLYDYSGLRVKVNDIYDIAVEVVRKLIAMGY